MTAIKDLKAGTPEFEKMFEDTLARFKALYPDRQDQLSALEGLMSEHSVDRLRGGTAGNELKLRLMWFIHVAPQAVLYHAVNGIMNNSAGDTDAVVADLGGTYRYFRYFAPEGRNQLQYVSGTIAIKKGEHDVPVMAHWSHHVSLDDKPEHRGFVFVSGTNLFMLATRALVLRLGVARLYDDPKEDRSTGHMQGLLLSVRNKQRDTFAARFVMVHESNAELISSLSADLGTVNGRGEALFRSLAPKDEDIWHMLV